MNERLRVCLKANVNFLLFDDIARPQGSSAACEAASHKNEKCGVKRSEWRGARHDQKIVTGSGELAKPKDYLVAGQFGGRSNFSGGGRGCE